MPPNKNIEFFILKPPEAAMAFNACPRVLGGSEQRN